MYDLFINKFRKLLLIMMIINKNKKNGNQLEEK